MAATSMEQEALVRAPDTNFGKVHFAHRAAVHDGRCTAAIHSRIS